MYFSSGLQVGNYIYLIECLSRCLISIHIPTGETRIETYFPWEYTENKIGMLSLNHNIIIYSPVIDHFLVYDCQKQQTTRIKLQGIERDESGFYYSNILIDQDDFIILPFKGKEIKRYGMNGELKFKDSQWCFAVSRECGCDERLYGNIRMDSACVAGNQLFFSLIYGNQNYLCRYELNQDEHFCSIIYHSEDTAIRGVYVYPNTILFRRIFPYKTEIVRITLDSDKKKTIIIDYPSMFEEDIYGDISQLKASFKNKIMAIKGNDLKIYQKIYNFEQADVYILNGILFNELRNEIVIPEENHSKNYSIEKTVREIKNSSFYQEGCEKLFSNKYIGEGRYKQYNLIKYLIEYSPMMVEKSYIKNKSIGKLIWKTIQ